ncbi:hypothetical protein [Nonomuraea sp. NPDC005692]|uniref:hypothetical protein n=1 Tax=Nonomuraea sp. NPDC005692 TaxID=3157168 RepID=UPI0033CF2EA5
MDIDIDIDAIVGRYVAVWNEADPVLRSAAIAALWAQDGVEFVESTQFRGLAELENRVEQAYKEFVAGRRYAVTSADDVLGHHDAITFTLQLTTEDGQVAWAARVVLIVGEDDLIRYDYHFTVQPLAA